MNTRVIILTSLLTVLPGCAITIPLGGEHHLHVSAPEEVFQALTMVDFATTVSAARKPACYDELGIPTAAIIGKHPSVGGVEGYWAVYSTAHLLTASWLDREVDATDATGWKVARRIFQVASIIDAGYAVQNNWRIGLRPFQGPGSCGAPPSHSPLLPHHQEH